MTRIEQIHPEGFARPKGYAHGMVGRGRTLYVGGQIGWDREQQFPREDLVGQFAQTLDNVLAVVRADHLLDGLVDHSVHSVCLLRFQGFGAVGTGASLCLSASVTRRPRAIVAES